MRRAAWWTVALGVLWAAIAGLLWDRAMALGVVAGAAVGGVNFWLLGRALGQVVADPERYRRPKSKWKVPAPLLLKWPLVLVMLLVVLLWLPVRAEGVAMGALISLVALTIAGFGERRDRPADEREDG
jgi:membrane protein YqaA with SNARE-associated domain